MNSKPENSTDCIEVSARFVECDSGPNVDPASGFWAEAPTAFASRDAFARPIPSLETTLRIQWSQESLYFLFVCPFLELYLRPTPCTSAETNELWNWDVAEVFLGTETGNLRRYKEFEISPQGEWVDIEVDLDRPRHEDGWVWKSGLQAAARIDLEQNIWYGFLRIPFAAIDSQPASRGNRLRFNFFRVEGREPNRRELAWQPTYSATFHVPEAFGWLRLA